MLRHEVVGWKASLIVVCWLPLAALIVATLNYLAASSIFIVLGGRVVFCPSLSRDMVQIVLLDRVHVLTMNMNK